MRLLQFPKAKSGFYDLKPVVRAEGEPSATDLWIYDVIGDDWFEPSLTAKELCQKIAGIESDEIVLHFNSPGGSASDGFAIYNALVAHPAKVTSIIEGWTGSVATIIALAGDTVRMHENTTFMIHNSWGINVGNASSMRDYAGVLDLVDESMSRIYLARCRKSAEELQAALEAETYLTAAKAAEWGFVDEVLSASTAAAACDRSVLEALGFAGPRAAGRTLSSENEGKLRDAASLIEAVLATLDAKAQHDPGDAAPTIDGRGLASVLTAAKHH